MKSLMLVVVRLLVLWRCVLGRPCSGKKPARKRTAILEGYSPLRLYGQLVAFSSFWNARVRFRSPPPLTRLTLTHPLSLSLSYFVSFIYPRLSGVRRCDLHQRYGPPSSINKVVLLFRFLARIVSPPERILSNFKLFFYTQRRCSLLEEAPIHWKSLLSRSSR